MEVRGHLIEKDEDGLVTTEQADPGFFIRGLGSGSPEVLKEFRFPELLGYLTPEVVMRIVPAVESGDSGNIKGGHIGYFGTIGGTEGRMLCQQPESHEQVGFTAAHRLLQVEDCLARFPGKTSGPFGNKSSHPLRQVGALKEKVTIPLRSKQLVKLLNLVANPDIECVVLKFTGVPYCFHGLSRLLHKWH